MLVRQRIILTLLARSNTPLSRMVFVKLAFLLRHETELKDDRTFYDFVPYRFGPFSFTLYHDLNNLRRDGYITPDEEQITLCQDTLDLVKEKMGTLPLSLRMDIDDVVRCYSKLDPSVLVKDIYSRYPWYTINSELANFKANTVCRKVVARNAVYTAGYESKSIDYFFNDILKAGIEMVVDVRANPFSRNYGYSKKQFSEIANKLGLDYCHMPSLGIPSAYRENLDSYASYQNLLDQYEHNMLPQREAEVNKLASLMQEKLAVLVCVEKDVRCCHRSRLADAVSRENSLEIIHL